MTRERLWLVAHAMAVAGAAFSLVVLIPYPGLWQHLPGAPQAYAFAMDRAGPLHIVLGAIAMLVWSWGALGPRFAVAFFVAATGISAVFELVGTGTGWPFGQYAYTSGLGTKILGRVPFSIPLSWYYLGLASWVLAREALRRWRPQAGPWAAIALGTWLLMAWDLVLDPAMAHPDLPLRFWIWHERGAYLGMPLINLVSWTVCGALFMGAARLAAGEPPPTPAGYAFAVYALNVGFGVVLCASLGLWGAIALAFVAGLGPAALALRGPAPTAT